MNKPEWDKITVWLLALFPNWNPDAFTLSAWFGELPQTVSPDQFIGSVRSFMAKKPSSFPPSIFEILGEIRSGSVLEGRKAWIRILVVSKTNLKKLSDLTTKEKEAVRLMGGIESISNSKTEDPFVEKRFLEIWNDLGVEEKTKSLIEPGAMQRLFGTTIKQIE